MGHFKRTYLISSLVSLNRSWRGKISFFPFVYWFSEQFVGFLPFSVTFAFVLSAFQSLGFPVVNEAT